MTEGAESKLSRERFEQVAAKQYPAAHFRRETSIDCDIYWNPAVQQLWELWQAAVRDTREQCSQLVKEFRDALPDRISINRLRTEVEKLERRLRGGI